MIKTIQVVIKGHGKYQLLEGKSVYSVLKDNGILEISNCGGNGTCGKCAVRFIMGAPAPNPHDRKAFSPQQLREGYRLACVAKPVQDCIIECQMEEAEFILSDYENAKMQDAQVASRVVASVRPEDYGDTYVVCDLGTTTIVVQLIEKETDKVIDTYMTMNPQRRFGADVITRMEKAIAGDETLLSECVQYCLESAVSKWTAIGFDPQLICISANTVMTHLFFDMDVSELATYPFTPFTTEAVVTDIEGIKTVFLPGFSAFVGGDLFAGAMVCEQDMALNKKKTALLLDLGTNGEMILWHEGKKYATATAAGPAFEGGATANVPGSDMIHITASLVKKGLIDQTGLIVDQHFHSGISVDGVHLRQEDVRGLQIAKAAIYAGIGVLIKKAGIEMDDIEKVYLAGGFGYLIDVQAAGVIGLIPSELVEKTVAVGNTSLAGAVLYAKKALSYGEDESEEQMQKYSEAEKAVTQVVNLAEEPEFEAAYVGAMNF